MHGVSLLESQTKQSSFGPLGDQKDEENSLGSPKTQQLINNIPDFQKVLDNIAYAGNILIAFL